MILKKTIAFITLFAFCFSNISFAAEINSFKLALPSKFSRMEGLEFRNAAQIQVAIRTALKEAKISELSLDSLKKLGTKELREKTVFSYKTTGRIYFNEAINGKASGIDLYTDADSYIVKVSLGDNKHYVCLISKSESGYPFNISVVPVRVIEDLKTGTAKFMHEYVDDKDKAIIDLYLEHEISNKNNLAIDEFIASRMMAGNYAVGKSFKYGNPLYSGAQSTYNDQFLYELLNVDTAAFLETIGVKGDNRKRIIATMKEKPLVIIPYDKEDELPDIAIDGLKVKAYAHSSEYATYIFVDRQLYVRITDSRYSRDEDILFFVGILEEDYIHEIGVRCGLGVKVKGGRAVNELDSLFSWNGAAVRERATKVSEQIKNLAPVNLLELEHRNDCAAGKVPSFKTILGGTVVAAVLLSATSNEVSKIRKNSRQETISNIYVNLQEGLRNSPKLANLLYEIRRDTINRTNPEKIRENLSTIARMACNGEISKNDINNFVAPMLKDLIFDYRPKNAFLREYIYNINDVFVTIFMGEHIKESVIDRLDILYRIHYVKETIRKMGAVVFNFKSEINQICATTVKMDKDIVTNEVVPMLEVVIRDTRNDETRQEALNQLKLINNLIKEKQLPEPNDSNTPAVKPIDQNTVKPVPDNIKETKNIAGTAQSAELNIKVDNILDTLETVQAGNISPNKANQNIQAILAGNNPTPEETQRSEQLAAIISEQAGAAFAAMGIDRKYENRAPDKPDIEALAARIKELGIEVFIPDSQLSLDKAGKYRDTVERVFGDRLRVYRDIDDLQRMIKNPNKSIVMTINLRPFDVERLQNMQGFLSGTRFMNFEKMDTENMEEADIENYFAETIAILLAARVITAEEAKSKDNTAYRYLAHLLEDHVSNAADIDKYILNIADNSIPVLNRLQYILKMILKAMPITRYKIIREAVQVLWAA